jgi:hypothetical protein
MQIEIWHSPVDHWVRHRLYDIDLQLWVWVSILYSPIELYFTDIEYLEEEKV